MAKRLLWKLVALGAMLGATGGSANAQSIDRKSLLAQQRRQYHEAVEQYPLLKQHHIIDVMRLRAEGAALVLNTPLPPDHDYTQRRAVIEGLSEPAVVLCWYLSQDMEQVQFELNVEDYSDAGAFGRLHLLARPNPAETNKELDTIEIEKNWQTVGGFKRVYFTQDTNAVRLLIYANEGSSDGLTNITLNEKNFASLRRNHPMETERWLRPVFRELRQESAFAADPSAAWQVLSDAWPVDASLSDGAKEQIKSLDDDDFRVRQAAAESLEKLGRDGAVMLMKMDRHGLSLEQNARIDEVIARFKPLRDAEAARLARDPHFLLDCLYGEDATTRKLALGRLSTLTDQNLKLDDDLSEVQRIDAVNALRNRMFPLPTTKP